MAGKEAMGEFKAYPQDQDDLASFEYFLGFTEVIKDVLKSWKG